MQKKIRPNSPKQYFARILVFYKLFMGRVKSDV